jgi:hypothetical protein
MLSFKIKNLSCGLNETQQQKGLNQNIYCSTPSKFTAFATINIKVTVFTQE